MDAAKTISHKQESPSGTLRIGTAESLLISVLPPIIMEFRKKYPLVEISIQTGKIGELFDMVKQNDVDLLFFLDKKTNFPEWTKVFEHLEPVVFAASSKHPLTKCRNISLEKIFEEPFLLTEKGISYRYDLEQMAAAANMEIHSFLETGNTEVITKLLLQNAGISYLPEYTIRDHLKANRLAILDVACPKLQMFSQLVYHRNKWVTPQMKLFIEIMKNKM